MKKLPDYIQAEYAATKQPAKDLKQELKRSYRRVKFSVTSACNVIGVKAINPYSELFIKLQVPTRDDIMKEFTFIELANFRKYEEVREEGLYNMFDPQARRVTDLTEQEYNFVMKNYTELREAELADRNNYRVVVTGAL